MNICIFTSRLSGGGAERVACSLSNHLSKKHHVTLITMSFDKPTYNVDPKVEKIPLSSPGNDNWLTKNIKRFVLLTRYIKSSSNDVYIVFPRSVAFILLCFKRMIKVPIIVSERCDPKIYYDSSLIRNKVFKKLFLKADAFIFQTNEMKNYYDGIISADTIVIPNAVDYGFVNKTPARISSMRIVSAGRLVDQKNYILLIKAFSQISKRFPIFKLVIYGDGPKREVLENYICSLGLSDRVFLPGYTIKLNNEIADAYMFVLPSNYEGMPNALIEAMALGLPCISTNCPGGGPASLIKDGYNGLLIPVNNEDKLIEAMAKLLLDKKLASRLGENASKVKYDLCPENIYNKWEDFIINITKRHSALS